MTPLFALVVSATVASAPTFQLQYDGVEGCLVEEAFRQRLAASLGRDPFEADAPQSMQIRLYRPSKRLFAAMLQLKDASGAPVGRREFSSSQEGCEEVTEAVLLAVSLAADPLFLSRKKTPLVAAPPTEPAPTPSTIPEPPPTPTTPPGEPWAFETYLWGGAGTRTTPWVTAVGALGLRVKKPSYSIGLEVEGQWPVRTPLETGSAQSSLWAFSFLPCLSLQPFSLCAQASGGMAFNSAEGVASAQSITTPWLSLGSRLEGRWPAGPGQFLGLVEVGKPLVVTRLRVEPLEVWKTPDWNFSLGMGYAWSL